MKKQNTVTNVTLDYIKQLEEKFHNIKEYL
jgi:hypothetical protein